MAKGAAFAAAILVLILIPQAVIFIGLVIAEKDIVGAFVDNVQSVPPILTVAATIALLLGSIGLSIAAFTPRRAYATAAIMAIFIVPGVVADIVLRETSGGLTRYIVLASPGSILDGVNSYLFGTRAQAREVVRADLAGALYLGAAAAIVVVLIGVVVRRYQRIEA